MTPTRTPTDRRWLALVLLAAAQFAVVLDASIVNVALPSIGSELHFSQDDLSWVVNAYVLVFGGFLLLGGRLADLLGRRRIFIAGLLAFAAASLAGGLARTDEQLIVARAVQGLGAALLSPAALSLLTVLFADGAERNKAMGVWGAVAGSGGAAGVLLGGMLTEWAGWEWVFFVNVPVGIAAALVAPRLLPESRVEGRHRFDVAGGVSITAGLTTLVYAVVNVNEVGWLSTQTLTLAGVALALIAAFIVIELRSDAPLVSFRIFRLRTLTGSNVVASLVAAAAWPMFLFVSLYMQQVLGFSALEAGLAYLPLALGIMLSAGLASQIVSRVGYKPAFIAGLGLLAVGLLLFAQVDARGSFTSDVLLAELVTAVGLGLSFVSITLAAVAGVPDHEAGLASGLVNASQQLGGALGIAILASVAAGTTGDALTPAALTAGFQDAFLVAAGIAVAGLVAAAVLISGRSRRAQRGEITPVPVGA